MGLSDRLERMVPDLAATLARFPVPALWSVLLTFYLNYHIITRSGDPQTDVIMAAAAGFFAAGAAHLFAEGRGMAPATNLALAAVAGLLAAVLGWFNAALHVSALYLFCGLIALTMVAAHLRRGATQGGLWFFNLRYGLAAILAGLAGLAFALGLLAIVAALKYLFGINPVHNTEEHIIATACALIAPVYGLSLMPRDLDTALDVADHRGAPLERGVSVLVNYILVPVVVVYALILHAYAVKIALTQSLPRGQIGTMVAIYAVGGTGVWLIAWPWRETGTRLLRLFMRGWFWLTIIPSALLVIAIWRRVADYGVTPDRYGIALIALWAVLTTAYLAYRRNAADMRAIVGAMAALLLVAAFGPQGAQGTTIRSQLHQFQALLERHGMWQDGMIKLPAPKLAPEAQTTGYSIIAALREAGGLSRVAALFPAASRPDASKDDWTMVQDIAGKLGFTAYVNPGQMVAFNTNRPLNHAIPAAAMLYGPLYVSGSETALTQPPDRMAWHDGTLFHVRTPRHEWTFSAAAILSRLENSPVGKPPAPVVLTIEPGVTLLVVDAYGSTGDQPALNSMTFWLIEEDRALNAPATPPPSTP